MKKLQRLLSKAFDCSIALTPKLLPPLSLEVDGFVCFAAKEDIAEFDGAESAEAATSSSLVTIALPSFLCKTLANKLSNSTETGGKIVVLSSRRSFIQGVPLDVERAVLERIDASSVDSEE